MKCDMENKIMLDVAENLILLFNFKFLAAITLIATSVYLLSRSSKHVYLVDFICYRAPNTHRVPVSTFIEQAARSGSFDSKTVEFQTKVMERSGIGNESYVPGGTHVLPYDRSLKSSLEEVTMVLFSVVQDLFSKQKINPKSIDILITNCSIVCPTPSLSAMIINKFGLRSNVKSFHLSGMGCSAGLLSISLAKDLLRVHKNSLVLVFSMESVCSNVYQGKVKSMLLSNCLFRMGGAAVLLSNRKSDRHTAKYELQHLVRTHLGAKESAHKCVFQESDNEGFTGVSLARSILQVAGEALKTNMATLATMVLPYSELIRYGISVAWKKIWPPASKRGAHIPDFRKAFEHFCIHAGGKAVIDAIKENLRLKDRDVEASKMTLYKFGNTSSSSVWYELGYLEAKGRVKRGDRIWQLTFGSGFKCNSAVWKCISKMKVENCSNVWSENIDRYPIEVPDVIDH
ncbi:3-ketoacyl-CoA synthase [Melia azedarach]|uniref:3-ketoacyl-CoA synthase n=1 Tax=Melia azedarach TaxID=155640 RepID=A0ACC1Y7Q0_MELAZ|nr:3-ketoacyl-CoA synthase [Melia azedarach]